MASPHLPSLVVLWIFHQSLLLSQKRQGHSNTVFAALSHGRASADQGNENYSFAWAKGEEDINHTVLVDLYELGMCFLGFSETQNVHTDY